MSGCLFPVDMYSVQLFTFRGLAPSFAASCAAGGYASEMLETEPYPLLVCQLHMIDFSE